MTSESPRWHGTATSALSTPNLWPWLWMPVAEEPSWCCPCPRWVRGNTLTHVCCCVSTSHKTIFGCVKCFWCELVWCFFFFFCSHVQKNENTASHHHTFSWIRKFDADFESFYTSLTLPLRSFHHIRSLLSAQSGQDVASAQLFCSHLWSTLDVWNPLYCILCAWKVENCTPYGHVYSQLMISVCQSMLSFSHRVMHVPTGLWIKGSASLIFNLLKSFLNLRFFKYVIMGCQKMS